MVNLLAQAGVEVTSEHRLEFARWPTGWPAVGLLAVSVLLVYVVVVLYRREARVGWSGRGRMFLAAIRGLVLLGLLLIWMEPIRATYLHRRVEAYTLVLADTSASMSLADSYAGEVQGLDSEEAGPGQPNGARVRRQDLLQQILDPERGDLLGRLRAANGVKLFAADETARLVGSWPAAVRQERAPGGRSTGGAPGEASETRPDVPALEARGRATDLERSLGQALHSASGGPVAGVVLLSDGAINRGRGADQVGAMAAAQNVKVYTVGIGDPDPPGNVRVAAVEAPAAVLPNDPFAVTVHLSADGLDGSEIEVTLYEQQGGADGDDVPLEEKRVVVGGEHWSGALTFQRAVEQPGRKTYRVAAVTAEPESITSDNDRQFAVAVQDGKLRVLLVSGGPSWDYRTVSRLLERDESIEVSCWLQSASRRAVRDGNTVIDHLPESVEELFAYDAIVLLDPRPDEFGPEWGARLSRWVEESGGGFLYCAGRKHTQRFVLSPGTGEIVALWPVVPDPESDLVLNRLGHYQKSSWPVWIPESAWGHPMLRQADSPSANRAIWQRLGSVFWHFPVRHEKQAAGVLMRHSNPQMRNSYGQHVLLACQFVGAGRAAFMAFDGTWRWRRYGEQYFDRFWISALRYLAEGRLLGGGERADLRLERDVTPLGQAVHIQARLLDEHFAPLTADQVPGKIRREAREAEPVVFRPLEERPGWYGTMYIPRQTGRYRISVQLPAAGTGGPFEGWKTFVVAAPDLETADPAMDRAALRTLARASGGAYFELNELDELVRAIEDRHEEQVVVGKPVPLWDRWQVLLLLSGLLSMEWALRKRARLL